MESLKIKRYKCIESLDISKLKSVNLFTGKNNTGKSTILEAISLLVSNGDFNRLYSLLDERGEVVEKSSGDTIDENIKMLSSLFPDRKVDFFDNNTTVFIGSDSTNFQMRFVKYIEEREENGNEYYTSKKIISDEIDSNQVLFGVEFSIDSKSAIYNLDRRLISNRRILSLRNIEKYVLHVISARGKDTTSIAELWDKIVLSPKEKIIIDVLRIIEPEIDKLAFVGDGSLSSYRNNSESRIPQVTFKNSGTRYPLKSMGDGMSKILNIILALVDSENGFLLIDEFENGLHHSIQEQLWEIIFKLSHELNVQVFVTTHSNDSIHSFASVLESNKQFEGSLYRLEKRDNRILSNHFSNEEITNAANYDIDLR